MRTPLVLAALVALASCAEEDPDERFDNAQHAEYVVPAIFRPSCGTAACHSSATAREGIALDTVEGVCAASRFSAFGPLTQYMTEFADPRMPLDSPLPDADFDLLTQWYFDDALGDFTDRPPGCP